MIQLLDEDLQYFEENSEDDEPTVAGNEEETGKDRKRVKWERSMFIVKMTEI